MKGTIMPMHATLINAKTVDFLAQVNGGLKPRIYKDVQHVLIYGDAIDDPPNQIITIQERNELWKGHLCDDSNCNIVNPV